MNLRKPRQQKNFDFRRHQTIVITNQGKQFHDRLAKIWARGFPNEIEQDELDDPGYGFPSSSPCDDRLRKSPTHGRPIKVKSTEINSARRADFAIVALLMSVFVLLHWPFLHHGFAYDYDE